MKPFLISLFILILLQTALTQEYFIRGTANEKANSTPISYANIRVIHETIGTAANKNGEYELKLRAGKYKLIASCIGYNSDTIEVNLNKNLSNINFYLAQTNINLPAITVLPGENPAIRIIKNAIEKKKLREEKLLSYEFDAYTKGIIKTQNDINVNGSSASLGIGNDSSSLKITGILENESKGYFKSPDNYKEIIIARKQSANFPSSINVLTGGRILQNFYNDKINFLGRDLPGPLANNALTYYYYHIKKDMAIDKKKVFEIYMEPNDRSDPGFVGNIFITDSTFDLIKVDLQLNRAANTGGLFDSVNVLQQFSQFTDSISMPVDYRLFVTANPLGLFKFGFEVNTVLFDYKINPKINNNFFNKAVLTVLPDADKKDSTYWNEAVTIPNTFSEQAAYKRIDSLKNIPRTFWDDFSPLSTKINFSKNFSISAPLGMYHFNRVEGNSIDFGFYLHNAVEQRLNSQLSFSYGFSDKKVKTIFGTSYLLGDYRTYKISFNAFNKLQVLFENSDNYNDLTSTLLALLSKDDFRDYYYSNGLDFQASGDVFPVLNFSLGFKNHTDKNAFLNTNFSILAKDRTYSTNPPIYESKINSISAGFNFDFRNYIEDGFFRRRISMEKSYATFGGKVIYSNTGFLKSDLDFTIFEFNSQGIVKTFNSAQFNFHLFAMYTQNEIPYQMLYSIPGNINLTAQNNTFRTLNLNEVLGSQVVTLNIEHNFHDELFRILDIPYLKDWELQLITYLNIAYSDINYKSKIISPFPVKTLTHPFYEIGFGIGQVLFPMRLDFSWRLNYRGENNFRIGINTFIIQ